MDVLNSTFENEYCQANLMFLNRKDMKVECRFKMNATGKKLYWWAAAPPCYGISLSGSGMPYANAVQAYDNTINKGIIDVSSGNGVVFEMKYPNAYYIGLGSLYVPPHINMKLTDGSSEVQWVIPVDNGIPFRMLTYPTGQSTIPRNSCMFYEGKPWGARSQEEILRASEYPSVHQMPTDFWANRPSR